MFYSITDIEKFSRVAFNFIKTEQEGQVFWVTLNRPEKRNAFSPTMVNELAFALAFANLQKDIWCVVIRANGPVFCAGMDLNVFQQPELDNANETLPKPVQKVSIGDALRLMNKPTIAQIEGNVYAGGFLIVGGCTLAVSTDTAEFSLPEVKRGIFPMQVLSTLLEFTNPKQAMRHCILGENLSAQAAQKLGLLSHVCPQNEVKDQVIKLTQTILSNSPYAISKGMDTLRRLQIIPPDARFGFLAEQLENLRTSDDAQEGAEAFREKRAPIWKNS